MEKPLIAVVNNDTVFLSLMNDLLSEEGCRTMLITAGDRAYEEIRKKQPNLIILDIVLDEPETGWKVLELIRLDPKTTNIPVIVASVDSAALKAKQEWLAQQQIDTLEKPFRLGDLLDKINKQLPPRRQR